ncbi:hypothetical protein TRVL_00167 [Trypanosoma vivax]|nr:hypothetical protein TRVL_00167 [Trypanosoma vivax]
MQRHSFLKTVALPVRGSAIKALLMVLLAILVNFVVLYLTRRYYGMLRDRAKRRHHRRSSNAHTHGKESVAKKSEPKMLFLLGLPGSGKTTWLTQYLGRCDDTYTVISADAVRTRITGRFDDFSHEEEVRGAIINEIVLRIRERCNVVLDDTRYVMNGEFRKCLASIVPSCRRIVKEFPISYHFAYARLQKDAEDGKLHHHYSEIELEDLEATFSAVRVTMKEEGWKQFLEKERRRR